MKILLANPRGFCAGVDRAIEIVKRALELFGTPIYVRHEVVHNRCVVDDLRDKGVVFVDELDEVPDGNIVIFSAHGVAKEVREAATQRRLRVFDATCPLVTKVHLEVSRYLRDGRECVLIGHAGHPEVEGTLGQAEDTERALIYLVETPEDARELEVRHPERLAFVTQTTLSMDDTRAIIHTLRQRYPAIHGPKQDDICYATQNRQEAVQGLASQCDVVFVVGSPNSSNSNRLKEIAQKRGIPTYLIDTADEIQREWVYGKEKIGITAGASAPEVLVEGVVERLQAWGAEAVEELLGRAEQMVFALPKALQ